MHRKLRKWSLACHEGETTCRVVGQGAQDGNSPAMKVSLAGLRVLASGRGTPPPIWFLTDRVRLVPSMPPHKGVHFPTRWNQSPLI